MHTAELSPPVRSTAGRNATPPLVDRHFNGNARSHRSLPQKPSCAAAWASAASSSSSFSSSSSVGATDCSVGSLSLRHCLDLLVRVQKTQAESVTLLSALRERLFPTVKRGDEPRRLPAVALDDLDREVVRLRIFEVKHSGLNPKLSEAIESVLLPFQSCFREGPEESVGGGASGMCWEPCGRVASLREQLMGLAQLQEEAINALGTQLSELFAPSSVKGGTLYYYPALTTAEDAEEQGGTREPRPHAAALRFLEQLEDVMASKQHIVVCLAVALREIYDPVAPAAASYFEALPGAAGRGGGGDGLNVFIRGDPAAARVSVSLSPPSTLRPSCSAPREESPRSPTGERCGRALERLLRGGQVQECRRRRSGSSPEPVDVDVEVSPSPKSLGCEMVAVKPACGEPLQAERNSYIYLRPSCESEASPRSGNPRSPSLCTAETGEASVTPPPPLARCLEKRTQEEQLQLSLDARPSLRQRDGGAAGDPDAHDASQSPSAATPSQLVGSDVHGNATPSQEPGPNEPTPAVAAENARLLRLLEAKDRLIIGMQERLLGSVPLLVERLAASNASSGSSCSCRSQCPSTHADSADEGPPPPPPQRRSASTSTCGPEIVDRVEAAPNAGRSEDSGEIALLKDRLAARMEDNHQLRAALTEMKEERRRWRRAARELKGENEAWRKRERAARARCEQLEEDIIFLKKRLLTSEGALMLGSAAATPVAHSEVPLLRTSASHHRSAEVNSKRANRDTGDYASPYEAGGLLASPTRSRSRTLPPPLQDEVPVPHTSASLQEKRNQLLAKLGRRTGAGTLPHAKTTSPESEEPMVVVSPLTEERLPAGGGAAPTTPPPPAGSFSASPGAVRIDRRLSPEYQSPQAEHVGGGRLSTADVNRILASARGVLRSVDAARNGHRGEIFPVPASCASSDSMWSDCDSASSGDRHCERGGGAARYTTAPAEQALLPPPRRSISPCSSLSYSSARKRARRPPRQWEQRETHTVHAAEPRAAASSSPPLSLSPPSPVPRRKGGRGKATPSPGAQGSTKPRPPTARETLMLELRDQLHLLQTQHAGVLTQEEQLQLKRMQVVAAIQRQSDGVGGSSSATAGRKRLALKALLERLDVTQERVQRNEARLREYVEIVKRQLNTLVDDRL
ncbi:uncharacterized protein Tco025E_05580 [Trypanosoma conorhini]|uniref:Uncharacterized protein n=1 Tax=Trypanosoma conorhini TaxID=83891 RepID=A0A3R7P117_9TRYP|nr:uncharacterized protein Tco025E_05580 [Trypanosoma conorhini]RNF15420.1 hypothetical protein Tco025E_05580 [Trypanosoma conorhini]